MVKFRKFCIRNRRVDWHGTKGMWVDRMLHPLWDFWLWPKPSPWPGIFKVKFWKSHTSGMGWLIDTEWKGCKLIECWTHVVTFNVHFTHDLDLGFSRSNFQIAVYRNARTHRHQTKGIWVNRVLYLLCGPRLLPWPWIFKVKFWKTQCHRNGRVDWHGKNGIWINMMLDPCCNFELWPHRWPLSWIFEGQVLKLLYLRNGRVDSLGMKGMWVGYDIGWTMGLTLCHSAWQIDQPNNGSMWNFYSFQPIDPWMGYSFTDLGAEGCCHFLNTLSM